MAQKPSIPKGTRDFSPSEVAKRNYIIETVTRSFKLFGFQPIETPAFENSETLMGKYGEEGDRLIFRILNSGDYLKKADGALLSEKNSNTLASQISEKALRYDLTVPFARYVVQHRNEIHFPFRRYQIQPVWRADRPQKGRFREFYQCDADIVGSDSLWQEVELVQLYDTVFSRLNLEGVVIKLNNRKVLSGIAEVIGARDKLIDFTVALDKLDKIGEAGVRTEMLSKGIPETALQKLQPLFDIKGTAPGKLKLLKQLLAGSETGIKGISELEFIMETVSEIGMQTCTVEIDITLARGLNYYTGTIFEVSAPSEVSMGSIGGGGRYDDLTGIFGLQGISGVGISFGLDRIYLVLEALDLFPDTVITPTMAMFINFGEKESLYAMKAISKLRQAGIAAELYPDAAKAGKQLGYADKREIPFVVLAGESELESATYMLKKMDSGVQEQVDFEGLLNALKQGAL